MPLPECALGGLAHGGKCRDQNVVERPAVCDLLLEFGGAGLQRLVGQCGDFRLERVDGVDAGLIALTRRSLAEPKNLRASAPIMPNSCLRGSCVAAVTWSTKLLINSP